MMDLNGDTGDSHPLHFHLTSGFVYKNLTQNNNTPNTPGSEETPGLTQTFSRDIYQIGPLIKLPLEFLWGSERPQQSISFALTWPFYASEDTTSTPFIPNIGAVIHCHFLPHNDTNSMMLSYAVKEDECFTHYCH